MRTRRYVLTLALLVLTIVPTALLAADSGDQMWIDQENLLWSFWQKRDIGGFYAHTTPDYINIDIAGLATTKAAVEADMKSTDLTSFKLTDFRIIRMDDNNVAVVYRGSADYTYEGKPGNAVVDATSLWHKKDGKWWAVLHQETPVAGPGK